MDDPGMKPLEIVDYDSTWPARFAGIGRELRQCLGSSPLRIDHIGSTAVPGLAAKDVIDVQVTVGRLEVARGWPDQLPLNLARRSRVTADHVPLGVSSGPHDWAKLYWSDGMSIHLHVREDGRQNQRYALLFRDFLRADPLAGSAYGLLKRALADAAAGNTDVYYAIKDPACDLILAGAEQWATRTAWAPEPSDA